MSFIRNFMLVIGPISSAFDFLTFYILLKVFQADEKLFTPAGSSNPMHPGAGDIHHPHAETR